MRRKRFKTGKTRIGMLQFIRESWLNWLLLFVPVSIVLYLTGAAKLWLFITSALAIIPLAGIIGAATEELSSWVGPGLGGLLNATFGNAPELIISLFAMRAGLSEVVKASISGSIIGNILLVLGFSMFAGGLGRNKQTFSRTRVSASVSMLFLAVVALVMPAVFDIALFGNLRPGGHVIERLSLVVAGVLLAAYIAGLIFSLKTHRAEFTGTLPLTEQPRISARDSTILLLIVTLITAVESQLLVGAISEATRTAGMTQFFVGAIVIAIVGNAAEHFTAVLMARRNQMELSVTIATSSSTQIALFVAPVLVFVSLLFGRPLSLVFNPFEIAGVVLAVLALSLVSLDGESNWFEGLLLMAIYVILAMFFYFVPAGFAVR